MTRPSPTWRPQFATSLAYAVAILSVMAALVVGLLVHGFLYTMPYVSLFLCAIMFSAWFSDIARIVLFGMKSSSPSGIPVLASIHPT